MAYLEIAIDNAEKNQTFQVNLDGNEYIFELIYNNRANRWAFGIADKNNNWLFRGLFLVMGIDYLGLINDARLPAGKLFMANLSDTWAEPTGDNLGVTCKMIYQEP